MRQFEIDLDHGAGGHEFVVARDWRAAMAWGREWARGGYWDVDAVVLVTTQDSSGSVESEAVLVGPLTPSQRRAAARRLARLSARVQR